MSQNIHVRTANISDLPYVLELVRELAVFEKEPDAVTATIADYENAFNKGLIGVHIAEHNAVIIAMIIYYDTFSTWKGPMLYLEDFYVKPEYRSAGVGSMLWDVLIEVANSRNCALIKWQVLDWNSRAIDFYKSKNGELDSDWYNGRLWLR